MGMSAFGVALLAQVLRHMGPVNNCERVALAFGYPDILASPAQLRELFGEQVFAKLTFRQDSAEIIRWHRAEDVTDCVVESASLFAALDIRLEVSDIIEARGGEVILDLNHACDPILHQRYDLLIDSGTLEHCFNIGQAVRNMVRMAKVGGYIFHGNPLNMYNHGFYNLNPTWYADFYQDNGFEILYLKAVSGNLRQAQTHDVPYFERFADLPADSTLSCIVKKHHEMPVRWPVQTKYKNNPTLKI